ncbi:GAF domain-containing protein [Leptolyngbya sp. NIES-2104]|uniref:GAF domain-containing protein n=1 Tax=Leptolyngbya sp. NIES-2104 TaxID=1552121 RepID=UPI00073F4470|nr:GAF domain-containing protein [Leptolyngbya sp. NIES-2104]
MNEKGTEPERIAALEAELAQARSHLETLQQENDRLRKSESRYRQVFENAPISMVLINTDGYCTQINSAAEDLFGLSINQLNQQAAPVFDNSQLAENGTLPYMQRAFAGEAVIEPPTTYDASRDFESGKFDHGRGHYAPIWNAAGVVEEIVEITADMNVFFAVQKELLQEKDRATQERARLLSTIAEVANLLLRSPDYITVLPDVVRLLGEAVGSDRCALTQETTEPQSDKPAVKLLNEWCRAGIPSVLVGSPEFQAGFMTDKLAAFEQQLLQGETVNFLVADVEEPCLRAFFEAHGCISLLIVPILVQGQCWGHIGFDNCGEARLFDEAEIAILKIAADSIAAAIERQAKEDELRKSEALYRSLFEISSEGIYRWHLDQPVSVNLTLHEQVELVYRYHSFVQANDALARMYGLEKGEEIAGLRLATVHQQSSEKTLAMMQTICRNGWQIRNAESEEMDVNGKKRYFLNSIISIIEDECVSTGWGTQIDITELRETQQALLQAEQEQTTELTRANEALKRSLEVLATEPDLDKFIDHVLGVIARQMNAPASLLWLFDASLQTVTLHLMHINDQACPSAQLRANAAHSQQLRLQKPNWVFRLDQRQPYLLEVVTPIFTQASCTFLNGMGIKAILIIPLWFGERLIGSFALRLSEARTSQPSELEFVQALAHQVTLAIQLSRLAEEAQKTVLLEERNRMAREIHDTLAQGFTGIVVHLEGAESVMSEDPEKARSRLDRARQLARESLAEARRSVQALRPRSLETGNLCEAISRLIQIMSDDTPLQIQFECYGTTQPLPDHHESHLLRITQEAVTNILKHADATHATITLTYTQAILCLQIQDDGQGFEIRSLKTDGFGLVCMRDRAKEIGADFSILSHPGEGTTICVTTRLDPEAEQHD